MRKILKPKQSKFDENLANIVNKMTDKGDVPDAKPGETALKLYQGAKDIILDLGVSPETELKLGCLFVAASSVCKDAVADFALAEVEKNSLVVELLKKAQNNELNEKLNSCVSDFAYLALAYASRRARAQDALNMIEQWIKRAKEESYLATENPEKDMCLISIAYTLAGDGLGGRVLARNIKPEALKQVTDSYMAYAAIKLAEVGGQDLWEKLQKVPMKYSPDAIYVTTKSQKKRGSKANLKAAIAYWAHEQK